MTNHESHRELSAGFVLGALEPEERRTFEAHLAHCPECRREVAAFAPLPGLLSRTDSTDSEPLPVQVADRAAAQARSQWATAIRSRRRWRWATAVAAVLALVTAIASMLPETEDPPTTVFAVSQGGVAGEVALDGRLWGTAVHVELTGLPQRDRYIAWVIDDLSNRQQVAAWGPTPAGAARLDGASSIQLDEVAFFLVTDGEGAEVALVDVTDG